MLVDHVEREIRFSIHLTEEVNKKLTTSKNIFT